MRDAWPGFLETLRTPARRLIGWLAPAGSFRQLLRIRLAHAFRQWSLPPRPTIIPPLPDPRDPEAISTYLRHFGLPPVPPTLGSGERVAFWIDFHPHVLSRFPLAVTPEQRAEFFAWLLTHRHRFGLDADDILAFWRERAVDPTLGLEWLYRRSPEWQRAVPNALSPDRWTTLQTWLKTRYRLGDDWLPNAHRRPCSKLDTEPSSESGVNLLANFCYPSGLQVAACNTRDALHAVGWHVSCRDVPNRITVDLPGRDAYLGLHSHPITIVQVAPEPLGRNSYEVARLAERPGAYRIGYWYWELDTAPKSWRRQRDWIRELWAPSRFIGDALRRGMPMPVIDMPPGIPLPEIRSVPRELFGLPTDRFVFLFAFDMSSVGERKNPRAVVNAFRQAFASGDPATLVLKVNRGWEEPGLLAELRAAVIPNRIVVLEQSMTREDVHALMNCCDAYVSLHRSEGFGLTLAEAMALGKPTIATAYSGNLDFMTEDNSLLVGYEMVDVGVDRIYPRGSRWADPSIDDAAAKMRWVVDHPIESRALAERGRDTIRRQLSLEAAGQRMATRLREITRSPR